MGTLQTCPNCNQRKWELYYNAAFKKSGDSKWSKDIADFEEHNFAVVLWFSDLGDGECESCHNSNLVRTITAGNEGTSQYDERNKQFSLCDTCAEEIFNM
jgi:hypothetical protein